ncbi:MAG: S9 family peptidase [Microbacteriaceae bacterium]
MSLTPPTAAKKPHKRVHHGDEFIDNYEWLRDKENPAVLDHLTAENEYTQSRTEHLALLQEQIYEEIKNRTQETDLSVPIRRGDWWYYTRTIEGEQYGVHCRAPISAADDWIPPVVDETGSTSLPGEQVILDDNAEADGHEFYALGSFDLSIDGSLLLYGVDTEGDERYTLRVRQLDTGENLPDEIPGTSSGALFDPSGRYIFYTTVDEAWRPDKAWRHEVGTAAADDVMVFEEKDEKFWVGIGRSRSRKFLVIDSGSNITSETWLLDTADPTADFRVVWPRRTGVEYEVKHAVVEGEDRLLIVHNNQAINFELISVPVADPLGPRRTVLPHRADVRLENVDVFRDHVVAEYRREGITRVGVAKLPHAGGVPIDDHKNGRFTELTFEEEIYSVGTAGNPDWDQPTVRLSYTSMVTPSTVYDYVVQTGELRLLKRQPVLGHFDPAVYEQRREWATAEDGTRIPISLVFRRDLAQRGDPAPTLLYGYGSYEHSVDPGFGIARLSLLDRGMVFAIAHVRGGGELGRLWYEHGKLLRKRNSFTDFVACAKHLIDEGYTRPEQLVAEGHSAGGLLVGAVANIAPELFAGVLSGVPFVDTLTTILDPSLPLTVIEWEEWGDPLHDPEVYAYMKAYSPYENVHTSGYPRILAVTSLNDTRVLYVEPAKWVARLREVGADVLLKTEMAAGHGGVSGRYRAWEERAFDYAWVLDAAGVHPH